MILVINYIICQAGSQKLTVTVPKFQLGLQRKRLSSMIPENYVQRVIQFARQGYTEIEFKTYDTDWDSEAYLTVAGQNSNNSVRVSNDYMQAVLDDGLRHQSLVKLGSLGHHGVYTNNVNRELWRALLP